MVQLVLFAILILPQPTSAKNKCIAQKDFNDFSYCHVDQNPDPGKDVKDCSPAEIDKLREGFLDHYRRKKDIFQKERMFMLYFHQAETLALKGKTNEALKLLERIAKWKDKKGGEMMGGDFNLYVRTFIAYLNKDKAAIRTNCEKMIGTDKTPGTMNSCKTDVHCPPKEKCTPGAEASPFRGAVASLAACASLSYSELRTSPDCAKAFGSASSCTELRPTAGDVPVSTGSSR